MSYKGDWSRVKNHKAYQGNYDAIFRKGKKGNDEKTENGAESKSIRLTPRVKA